MGHDEIRGGKNTTLDSMPPWASWEINAGNTDPETGRNMSVDLLVLFWARLYCINYLTDYNGMTLDIHPNK